MEGSKAAEGQESPFRLGVCRRGVLALAAAGSFLQATWRSQFWFLLPFALVLLLLSVLFVLAATMPAIAPFVYAIF